MFCTRFTLLIKTNSIFNTMLSMTCTCGFESAEGASFCASCGKDFRVTAPDFLELDESTPINRSPSRASLREVKREAKARKKNQAPSYRSNNRSWTSTTEFKVAATLISLALVCFLVFTVSSDVRPTIGSFVSDGFNGLNVMAKDLGAGLNWVLRQITSLLEFVKDSL